jgi:hypothetical protein
VGSSALAAAQRTVDTALRVTREPWHEKAKDAQQHTQRDHSG